MANRTLIQSNFDSTDIYRMIESDFDKSVFENQSQEYIGGLFDFKDVISTNDIWEIKDLAKLSPIPLLEENKDRLHNLSVGYYCERPVYIPINNKAYIYPLGDDELYRIPTDIYLGNSNQEIPVIRSIIEDYKEQIYEYNTDYKQGSNYSTEFNNYYLGTTPSSSYIHNLIKYNLEETSWESNWGEHAKATSITDNIFFTSDLVRIEEKDDNDIIFESTIQASNSEIEAGTYCFSFFGRVEDILYRDNNDEEVDYRASDPTVLETSSGRSWITVLTDEFDSVEYTLHKGLEYTESDGYVGLDSIWRRFAIIFTIKSNRQSLRIRIKWPKNYIKGIFGENRTLPIRIGGLLLEKKNYPSSYDKRYVIYDNSSITKPKYHPLAIYFGKSNNLTNSSWTINYKRLIEAKSEAKSQFFDTIGKINFGYRGNKAIVSLNGENLIVKEISNINNFYNHQESIFITFNKENSTLKFKVVSSNSSYEMSTVIADTQVFKEIVIDEENYKYHLLLGGISPKELTPGYYSDVIFIPTLISDTNINLMINSYIAQSISTYRYNRDYIITPENPIEVSWHRFTELSSAKLNETYKLLSGGIAGEKEYKAGDILFCTIPFNKKLNIGDIPLYWSYTSFKVDEYKDISDSTIFRAPLFIEGYEKIVEKSNSFIKE